MKVIIFILTVMLSTVQVHAGQEGNGGDGLLCKDGTVTLLDFYEANLNGYNTNKELSGENWKDALESLINNWSQIAPERTELYLNWLSTFEEETSILEGINIPDIPDHGELILPEGCEIVQVALQREKPKLGQKKYIIDKKYWDKMNKLNKAGLVLHELTYREAISFDQTNSINARLLNSFLMFGEVDKNLYVYNLSQLRYKWVEFGDLVLKSGFEKCKSWEDCNEKPLIEFYDNFAPKLAHKATANISDYDDGSLSCSSLTRWGKTYFHKNGSISGIGRNFIGVKKPVLDCRDLKYQLTYDDIKDFAPPEYLLENFKLNITRVSTTSPEYFRFQVFNFQLPEVNESIIKFSYGDQYKVKFSAGNFNYDFRFNANHQYTIGFKKHDINGLGKIAFPVLYTRQEINVPFHDNLKPFSEVALERYFIPDEKVNRFELITTDGQVIDNISKIIPVDINNWKIITKQESAKYEWSYSKKQNRWNKTKLNP